ncbi:MAG TPA: arsenate reductase ArsC [Actinomycetota bacterium]|nr:arsenate reductase ArsC [Actinomycetota bacterium]
MSDTPEVLFVCVHNGGRSQIAAGFLQHYAGDRVRVRSGGSAPEDQVNPLVVAAMAEAGIDISAEVPKKVTDAAVEAADVVVTMGCGDACPFIPGKRYEDWDLSDPSGTTIEEIRPIRDDIECRVIALLDELVGAQTGEGAISNG